MTQTVTEEHNFTCGRQSHKGWRQHFLLDEPSQASFQPPWHAPRHARLRWKCLPYQHRAAHFRQWDKIVDTIGTNKTATSLIQSCCSLERGLLQEHGIDFPAIDLLRHLDRLAPPRRPELARLILQATDQLPPRPDEGLLTAEIQQRLLRRYQESNRRLAARFWTDEETSLFNEQQVKTYPKPYSGMTTDEVAQVIAALWQDHVRQTPRRAARS